MKQFYTRGTDNAGIGSQLMAGCTTGAMAVAFAQPTDMVKVQFRAQVRGAERVKRCSGTMDAYRTIGRTEGIRGLWKGCGPNITRNAIVNCSELVTYNIMTAFSAGFISTIVVFPVDVVKTWFMNCSAGKYNSTINCAVTMMRNEGPKAFYKGFMPSFLRLGSWNIVMFVTYEQIKMPVMRSQQSWESLI
uniref:Solute carrier family 25 member 7 n=1 Tax=Salmo trutta TaxID=8032 RepID=A0A674BYC9_SALTR